MLCFVSLFHLKQAKKSFVINSLFIASCTERETSCERLNSIAAEFYGLKSLVEVRIGSKKMWHKICLPVLARGLLNWTSSRCPKFQRNIIRFEEWHKTFFRSTTEKGTKLTLIKMVLKMLRGRREARETTTFGVARCCSFYSNNI